MAKGFAPEFGAVLSGETSSHPAVFLTSVYERSDLPAEAVGFFGVVLSQWRPNSWLLNTYCYFGTDGQYHIRFDEMCRVIRPHEFFRRFSRLVANITENGKYDALLKILTAGLTSLPVPMSMLNFLVRLEIDKMIVIPDFGCIIEGWIVSPTKAISNICISTDNHELQWDERFFYQKPRVDLRQTFPQYGTLINTAGIVAVFLGGLPNEELSSVVVTAGFEDDSYVHFPVERDRILKWPESVSIEEIYGSFPSVDSELFFPQLAQVIRRTTIARGQRWLPYNIKSAQRVVVFSTGKDKADTFLLFDELARKAKNASLASVGIVIIAERNTLRSSVITLFDDFSKMGVTASLVFMENIDFALYALDGVLRAVQAHHFVFVRHGVFLTPAGWNIVLNEMIKTGQDDLVFLGAGPEPDLTSSRRMLSVECFGWLTTRLSAWAEKLAILPGEIHHEDDLLAQESPTWVIPGAIFRTTPTTFRVPQFY
jgi:hypothetical protein